MNSSGTIGTLISGVSRDGVLSHTAQHQHEHIDARMLAFGHPGEQMAIDDVVAEKLLLDPSDPRLSIVMLIARHVFGVTQDNMAAALSEHPSSPTRDKLYQHRRRFGAKVRLASCMHEAICRLSQGLRHSVVPRIETLAFCLDIEPLSREDGAALKLELGGYEKRKGGYWVVIAERELAEFFWENHSNKRRKLNAETEGIARRGLKTLHELLNGQHR